jgi:multicomponent K+:H+ antiporter subunit G
MMGATDIPFWLALSVAFLVLSGGALTLLGSIGLLRLQDFYERVHAPTLAATLGIGFVLLGSMLFFSVQEGRFVLHEILIGVFVIMTTPVTLMVLARAALYRDRRSGDPGVPPPR